MRSHFRLRRRDLRWLLFPALALAAGALTVVVIMFTPGHILSAYEFPEAKAGSVSGPGAAARETAPQPQ